MNDAILIDECLSPYLTAEAAARGFYAVHVAHRGLAGEPDHKLLNIISDEDFIFATSNRRDFVALYRKRALHPGLIVLIPGYATVAQQREFLEKLWMR